MKTSACTYLLSALCSAFSATVSADEALSVNDEITIYNPSDFDRFAPRTALDLVERVPGFSIRNGDSGQRGLGRANGNVLINGQRITSKDDSATDVLKRISVVSVIQLEVFDGAISSVPGLSGQIVNVTVSDNGFSGTFSWAPRFDQGDNPMISEGEFSVKGNRGRWNYNLGIESTGYKRGRIGVENVYDGSGEQIEYRDIDTYFYHTDPTLVGGLGYESEAGSLLTVSSKYRRRFVDDEENYQAYQPTASDDLYLTRGFASSERERSGELGVDYEFGWGVGRLKLISLYSFEHSPYENRRVTEYLDLTPTVETRYDRVQDEVEKIVRGEYSWNSGDIHSWQLSGEMAFNSLEAKAHLVSIASDGEVIDIDLPNANSSVEESRREANLSYGRPLTNTITLQLSLGAEYSEISQSGAVGQTREFVRPKGFASLAWRPNDRWSLSAKVEHQVGQLNFDDFIASVDLEDDTADVGNPNLVPPKTWLLELESVISFGPLGVVNLRAYREFISDIVDQIPIGATGEAPGNIDSADRYGVETTTTIQFDTLGLPGVRLNLEANYLNSEIEDPLTGELRSISGEYFAKLDMEIRHDIQSTDVAWGFKVFRDWETDKVRLNQISSTNKRVWFSLFAEHKNLFGLTGRLELQDISRRSLVYTRDVYLPRRTGPLSYREETKLEDGLGLIVTVSGGF